MLRPNWAGLRVRSRAIAASTVVLVFAVLATLPRASAHEGHDHKQATAPLPVTANPRAAATGDEFEAVAILRGGELLVFVDRFADNGPITTAAVTVTIGTQEFQARPAPDGTYRVAWPAAVKPGRHDLVIAILDGATADLLITTLEIPATASALGTDAAPGLRDRARGWIAGSPLIPAFAALVVIAMTAVLMRRRMPGTGNGTGNEPRSMPARPARDNAASRLVLFALVLVGGIGRAGVSGLADDGRDHAGGPPKPLAVTGDAPRRLPDGSIFLPKPSQRLLDVRAVLVKDALHQPSQTLVGRVVANPNRSGLVQSSTGGRITPTPAGLPKLGQTVKAGDILATVTPAFRAIDSATITQTAGDLDQQIELARTKLERAQRLLAANAGTRVQAEEADLTLKGLMRRRAALATSQIRSEPLFAPVDGVISSARAVPGQVVAPQDILFEIIDASSLWVEALVFEPVAIQNFERPVASTHDGASFPLSFVGRSRSLRQQSAILHFEITAPPQALDVGTPVTVHVQAGEPITAIVLPKAAVVRSANGEDVVWRHTEPERFMPTPVKVAPFDGTRVLVQAGLSSGQRIVVQSAELISQVR